MVREEPAASAEAIRAELRKILESSHFDASERNRRFLAYVVEEGLAGRAERIKAYAIATTVFGRDESFDPQLDSIVRIEAGRLRRSLEHYYLTDGRESQVRIDIPRGGYSPAYHLRGTLPAPKAVPAGMPSVLVATFDEEGDHSAFPSFTRGFTRSLIIALARFIGLRVFGTETALHHPADIDPQNPRRALDVDYTVTGQASLFPDRFSVDVLLVDARTGRAVWAQSFERRLTPSEIIALRNEVANRVARAIAQPYGAIQNDCARDADGAPPEALGNYAAVLLFYAYWRTFDREMIEAVRMGLERAVAVEPDYAEAFACLSLVYSNAHRFRHFVDVSGLDPQERAVALAARAVELAPSSSWARYALGLARWFGGDPDGALEALEMGRALNPNDTTILADLGQRYAMLAQWDKAVPLLAESYACNPLQPGSYRIGLFLYHYFHGRHAEALAEARQVDAPQVLYGHVAIAAAAAELGLTDQAAEAVAAVRALDPDYGWRLAEDLESRFVAPSLVRRLVASLAKAGLPGVAPSSGS
ncbi:tetratricopeptide repeat protein [Xanthobacter flavus]|uniref:tetratricopeptide repeat protein n=1 Tax=Xanthobacter flavus TaxID=281 RepID=UPI003726638C